MKRKIFTLISLFLIAILMFTACSSGSSSDAPSQEATDKLSKDTKSETVVEDSNEATSNTGTSEKIDLFSLAPTIEETVLYDANSIKITAKELTYTLDEAKLKLSIENNSDKDISVISGSIGYNVNAVNRYMMEGMYLNVDVTPGSIANKDISIDARELLACGITDIQSIDIGFHIQDKEYHDIDTVGPILIETSLGDSPLKESTFIKAIKNPIVTSMLEIKVDEISDEVKYSDKGIEVVSSGLLSNKYGDQSFFVEISNTTDETLVVKENNIAVNGVILSAGLWDSVTVLPGHNAIMLSQTEYVLKEEIVEALNIQDLNKLSLDITVCNEDYEDLNEPQTIDISDNGKTINAEDYEVIYENSGLTLRYVGLVEDSSGYSNDVHLYILVGNATGNSVYPDVEWGSMSVNQYMTGELCLGGQISNNSTSLLDIEINGDELESNDITLKDQISNIKFKLDFKDNNYNTIADDAIEITR